MYRETLHVDRGKRLVKEIAQVLFERPGVGQAAGGAERRGVCAPRTLDEPVEGDRGAIELCCKRRT